MRVLTAELKKMFSLKNLLPLLLVLAVFVVFFDMWNITPASDDMWELDLVKLYGTQLSQEEFERAQTEYIAPLREKANKLIAESEILAKAGIYNYEDFYEFEHGSISMRLNSAEWLREMLNEDMSDEEFQQSTGMTKEEAQTPPTAEEIAVYNEYFTDFDNPTNELYATYRKIRGYESQMEYSYVGSEKLKEIFLDDEKDYSPQERARVEEFFTTDEYTNICDDNLRWILNSFSIETFITVLACVFVFLAPVLTRDNLTGVLYLQYSSKGGRKILFKQLAAMLTAATAVTAFISLYQLVKFMIEVPVEFLNCGLNGFNAVYDRFWAHGTVLQYLLSVIGFIFAFVTALTLFLFALSHSSKNYIQLLLKALPVAAVMGGFAFVYGEKLFMFEEHGAFSEIIPLPYSELIVAAALLAISAALAVIFLKRNKARDIL